MMPLEDPVPVGDVTAREATELRERQDAANALVADIAAAEERVAVLRRLARIVHNEQVAFVTGIISRLGLDPRASYRVDERTGVITRVAVPVAFEPPAPVRPAAVDQEDEGETHG